MTTPAAVPRTANDRFKRSFDTTLGASLVVATCLHVLVFSFFPELTAADWARPSEPEITAVRMEQHDIPEKPQEIARPAAPVAVADVPVDATIASVGFDEYVELPPPPPADEGSVGEGAVAFVPFTVAPRLLNSDEVQRTLQRRYPPALRDAGLGGTVSLLVHIDSDGTVLDQRVGESSGFDPIDVVALGLTELMRFSPAMNRDTRVAVWIQIPLTFQVR